MKNTFNPDYALCDKCNNRLREIIQEYKECCEKIGRGQIMDNKEIEDIKFELKRLINSVYNYIDGFSSKFQLETFAKEIDKRFFEKTYAGDVNVSEALQQIKEDK